jgi:Bacterial Ig domain
MPIKIRKMNIESHMRVASVLLTALLLLGSTIAASLMMTVIADQPLNLPPNEPKDPDPANGSINISITTKLRWTGGDPDGNNVTYTVFFGNATPPAKVIENISNTSYTPGTLSYNTKYFWQILAWDNQSASTLGAIWEFTTEMLPNSPPNTPNTPSPGNGSTGVSQNPTLTWKGGDPDNDTVLYDVYLGITMTPPLVSMKQNTTSYVPPTLAPTTLYYWKVIAWDSHNASTKGPLWHFTTKAASALSVEIVSPKENYLYMGGNPVMTLNNRTIVYGKITIQANVTGSVKRVDFYLDGVNKSTDYSAPYQYNWTSPISFHGLSLKRSIKVVAYAAVGNQNVSAELNVTKWRFHILPFVVAAAIVGSGIGLVPHTNVQALVIGLHQSGHSASFYAIRLHYKTVGPFKSLKGTIHFKQVSVRFVLGPISMLKFGPLHALTRITFTCLGPLRYGQTAMTPSAGGGRLMNLLQGTSGS